MSDILDRIAKDDRGPTTHWEGCDSEHLLCAAAREIRRLRSSLDAARPGETCIPGACAHELAVAELSELVWAQHQEIRRLHDIIRPGDAVAYEEGMAAKDEEIARLRAEVESLRAKQKAKQP